MTRGCGSGSGVCAWSRGGRCTVDPTASVCRSHVRTYGIRSCFPFVGVGAASVGSGAYVSGRRIRCGCLLLISSLRVVPAILYRTSSMERRNHEDEDENELESH